MPGPGRDPELGARPWRATVSPAPRRLGVGGTRAVRLQRAALPGGPSRPDSAAIRPWPVTRLTCPVMPRTSSTAGRAGPFRNQDNAVSTSRRVQGSRPCRGSRRLRGPGSHGITCCMADTGSLGISFPNGRMLMNGAPLAREWGVPAAGAKPCWRWKRGSPRARQWTRSPTNAVRACSHRWLSRRYPWPGFRRRDC